VWVRKGFCNQCGACCNIKNWILLNGFQVNPDVEFDEDGWCKYIDRETMRCTIHDKPDYPKGCASFPVSPKGIEQFPQCTYRFEWVDKS